MLEHIEKMRDKTRISLNKQNREQEQKQAQKTRLDLENRRRAAKGLSPVENLDEIEEDDSDKKEDKKAQDDPVLIEGSNILVDLMAIIEMSDDKQTFVRTN
jgi:carboxyl-terminal processing protease